MIQAYVFDAYGMQFDMHSAASRHPDFWTLTERTLDHAMAATGVTGAGLREALLSSYRTLDA